MSKNVSPYSWQVPGWHPDFGDPQAELDHLRHFATRLIEQSSDVTILLATPEPGMMYLDVTTESGISVEVYSVTSPISAGKRRYGVFVFPGTDREIEKYAETSEEAIRIVTQQCGQALNGNN